MEYMSQLACMDFSGLVIDLNIGSSEMTCLGSNLKRNQPLKLCHAEKKINDKNLWPFTHNLT